MDRHRQCHLRRGGDHQVSWLPERYAIAGQVVKLRKRGDEWDDGWHVDTVGAVMASDKLADRERDYLNQREASDWYRK